MGEDFDLSIDSIGVVEITCVSTARLEELLKGQRALTDAIRERNLWRGLTIVLGLGELALLTLFFWRAAPWV
ncbi:MAG: hypothetical protein IJ991_00095 [Thermoguttaceae bacterium]|nr:hypothetical protein [Thermoguttaceae bacterium]